MQIHAHISAGSPRFVADGPLLQARSAPPGQLPVSVLALKQVPTKGELEVTNAMHVGDPEKFFHLMQPLFPLLFFHLVLHLLQGPLAPVQAGHFMVFQSLPVNKRVFAQELCQWYFPESRADVPAAHRVQDAAHA